MDIGVFLAIMAFCGVVGAFLDGMRGFLLGALLGVVGLIIAAILGLRSAVQEERAGKR